MFSKDNDAEYHRSIFHHVAGHQYNVSITNIHPPPITPLASASNASLPSQAPPIDNLSIHFTGRKKALALIRKAFKRSQDILLCCALHGNQGMTKSHLTYFWAKSTFASKQNTYIIWITATPSKSCSKGFADSSAFPIIQTNRIPIKTLD